MDKYIGRLLDNRYEILEVLGVGGMAVVYKARCHRLNRFVAVKILKDDFLQDEEFRRRFHSESQAVAMLSHSNIVSVYDVSTSADADYIVMELIDGITLKQYMEKKGVLNWKETLHFAIQIAKALEHAHGRGIVHRDIKPHNVMVLKNGSVKVTDFGIARMMSEGNTLTKEALGSVHYISPEQAKGGRVDNRSDIYSLGVVLYEMMSGRPPYDGESPVAVAIKHINGGAPLPSTLNPNIPGGLEQIIMKAMGHEPADRYDTATKMLVDLDEFRKNPGILFDYNTPKQDIIAEIPKIPLVLDPQAVRTPQPERVEHRNNPAAGAAAMERRAEAQRQARRRRLQAEQERKRSNAATIAIISCSLVMVAAIIIFLVILFDSGFSSKPQMMQVPDLVGKVYEEVKNNPDFEIKIASKEFDDEVPEGHIISQTPEAGIEVEIGNSIAVVVSKGKQSKGETTLMPDVLAQDQSKAVQALTVLGMNLVIEYGDPQYHDEIKEGCIIASDPEAHTVLTVGQKITLVLSLGKEIRDGVMPEEHDIVGKPLEEVTELLNALDLELKLEILEEYSSDIPAGCVIRTDPAAGAALQTGNQVKIIVSLGPELKKMQDLVGMSKSEAIDKLLSEGFTNYEIEPVESDKPKDTVIEQSIAHKTEVDVNTKIVLKVSKGVITKTIELPIPTAQELGGAGIPESNYTDENGNVHLTLTLKLDGEVVHTVEGLKFGDPQPTVSVTIFKDCDYELWLNGNLYTVITVDFAE